MHVTGIVTSVDYGQFLGRGLAAWAAGLDDLVVVTSPGDLETQRLCRHYSVRCLVTGAFAADGALFNKAKAIDEALLGVSSGGWVLLFDADMVPPADWRKQVERSHVRMGCLYGANRYLEDGRELIGELAGFFHLWHLLDHRVTDRPLLGSWHNASGYDSQFVQRWPADKQVVLDLRLLHLGAPGRNWCGVGRDQDMANLHARRQAGASYLTERLDRKQVQA